MVYMISNEAIIMAAIRATRVSGGHPLADAVLMISMGAGRKHD